MMPGKLTRRQVLKLAAAAGTEALNPFRSAAQSASPSSLPEDMKVRFVNVAREAGLVDKTIFGGEHKNLYLLETTGCGVAFLDYDNDDWLDIFVVNGWRVGGFPRGDAPTNHLYKNNRNGTFSDVTEKAGLVHSGWGQGVCGGDYDNDGYEDLLVTYWGYNVLYHNNGDGSFTDVTEKAGLRTAQPRWSTGCAFVDYDRDGHLDLFVANYVALTDLKTWPLPSSGPCLYKGVMVACGPPGLPGAKNILYHNNGDGTFTDVSEASGILKENGTYGLGVLTADFDNDGWPEIYVANDSQPSALYQNNRNGTFTDIGVMAGCAYSQDGKPQAGMGASAGDYDCDGWLDIFKSNFSEDTCSLYHNVGQGRFFDDVTFAAGLGLNTRYLGWGCGFVDLDNDGWPDIFLANGHIYPELKTLSLDIHYAEPKVVYYNLRNGRFADISSRLGADLQAPVSARGCAFGDFDNDGDVDIVVNTVNDYPQLFRCDSRTGHHWIKVRTIGTKSNRSGIGARVRCLTGAHQQIDEVRSGGGYASQSDLRVHFGLGEADRVDRLEVRWPSGAVDELENVDADQLVYVQEGKGLVHAVRFTPGSPRG